MKRIILLFIVAFSVLWIAYSSYELWVNKDNSVQPKHVFCLQDQSVLLVNQFEEIKSSNYFDVINENPLSNILNSFENLTYRGLKFYISAKRPIIILEKENNWRTQEIDEVNSLVKLNNVKFRHVGTNLMLYQDYKKCPNIQSADFLSDADKKASANFWTYKNDGWERTDIYNLNKGFFEYRSSASDVVYGRSVQDIPYFSPQIPNSINTYFFKEKFYAAANDTIFEKGLMNQWIDKGYVEIDYDGQLVIISDYKTQQLPSLILVEQSEKEDSVFVLEDMYSFAGFQLTNDFPAKKNGRFYCFEIEDKVLFVESKNVARKILVDYQLGKMLSLSPERQTDFFEGLPSRVNMRAISSDKKSSLTWKGQLLFEVNTQPPGEQLKVADKTTWSVSALHETEGLIPIPDHIRGGTSVLNYDKTGKYVLFDANGNTVWKGDLKAPVEGEIRVIDVFDNNKHQFLFRANKQVYLMDLNGQMVGGFPYRSDYEFSSSISDFVWNGTKRFLVGNEKGEIVMLNSGGRELNIIQIGKEPVVETPFAVNVKGNLRVWSINSKDQIYLGYLEVPAKPATLQRKDAQHFIKSGGKIVAYIEKDNEIYYEISDFSNKPKKNVFLDKGKITNISPDFLVVSDKNECKVFDDNYKIIYNKKIPFNEIGKVNFFPKAEVLVVSDYLQNKIHAYDKLGNEVEGFPKEGRDLMFADYNEKEKTLYVYTLFNQSIVCYKTKL